MADKLKNPVPFNPAALLTVNQFIDVADTLSTIYTLLDRGGTADDVMRYVEQSHEYLNKKWNRT
jgi:hypothetical protein